MVFQRSGAQYGSVHLVESVCNGVGASCYMSQHVIPVWCSGLPEIYAGLLGGGGVHLHGYMCSIGYTGIGVVGLCTLGLN